MRDPRSLYELNPDVVVPTGLPPRRGADGLRRCGRGGRADHGVPPVDARHDRRRDLRRRRAARLPRLSPDHPVRGRPPHRLPAAAALASTSLATRSASRSCFSPATSPTSSGSGSARRCSASSTARGVVDDVDQLDPDAGPHTRPIGVTVSGNRADLIEAMSVWGRRPRCRRTRCTSSSTAMQGDHPTTGSCCSSRLPVRRRVPVGRGRGARGRARRRGGSSRPTRCASRAASSSPASTSRSPRTASSPSSCSARGAPRLVHGGHDAPLAAHRRGDELPSADEIAAELEKFLAYRGHARRRGPTGRAGPVRRGNAARRPVVASEGRVSAPRIRRGVRRGGRVCIMGAGPVLVRSAVRARTPRGLDMGPHRVRNHRVATQTPRVRARAPAARR